MFTHFFWDFDGTLFDTYPPMAQNFKEVLSKYGYSADTEEVLFHLQKEYREAVDFYTQKYSLGEDFAKKLRELGKKTEEKSVKPYPFIAEALKEITKTGGKNYIFTHRNTSALRYLKSFGLLDYFTDWVLKDNNFRRKPDPEGLIYLINKHGINKKSAVMIGDRAIDIESAHNAGIAGCFFKSGKYSDCDFAEFKISSIKEVKKLYR